MCLNLMTEIFSMYMPACIFMYLDTILFILQRYEAKNIFIGWLAGGHMTL